MIGMVLVTHGALALALRDAMEHVVGKQTAMATVCIESDAEIEGQRAEVARRVAEVDMDAVRTKLAEAEAADTRRVAV